MTTERYIRIIAGTFVLVSLALGTWVNHNWYWFTAFVGAESTAIRLNAMVPDGGHSAQTRGWDRISVQGHTVSSGSRGQRP